MRKKKDKKSKTASDSAKLTWRRTEIAKKHFKRIYGKNYETYHKGWPDFIALNRKTGTFLFIECKRENEIKDKVNKILSYEQDKVRKILERIGKKKFRYEIWFFENKRGSKKIVKKAFCDENNLVFLN